MPSQNRHSRASDVIASELLPDSDRRIIARADNQLVIWTKDHPIDRSSGRIRYGVYRKGMIHLTQPLCYPIVPMGVSGSYSNEQAKFRVAVLCFLCLDNQRLRPSYRLSCLRNIE